MRELLWPEEKPTMLTILSPAIPRILRPVRDYIGISETNYGDADSTQPREVLREPPQAEHAAQQVDWSGEEDPGCPELQRLQQIVNGGLDTSGTSSMKA